MYCMSVCFFYFYCTFTAFVVNKRKHNIDAVQPDSTFYIILHVEKVASLVNLLIAFGQ